MYQTLSALDNNKRTVTKTCTIRVGSADDDFAIDHPVDVVNPAANTTITIPNGAQIGQELLVTFNGNSASKTLALTTTTGTDFSSSTSGQFTKMVWTGSVGGWKKLAGDMT
jgi:hypothetical protein